MTVSESNFSKYKTIFIASDHAGFEMKQHLIGKFPFLPWKDLGTYSTESVDYPDYAVKLCKELEPRLGDSVGVLICGSAQGIAMRANRFPFIRAAIAWSVDIAKGSRLHNNANVLCLAGRHTALPLSEEILKAFLTTEFEGGRHQKRVDKLNC